ncbi:MAG TPA: adenylate/guanylate cyclase domain-containing protein [Terriglobia bacterium]|nr:adenylate/guanylate cyclase domain-containing protein [Terriglobia bacterium]
MILRGAQASSWLWRFAGRHRAGLMISSAVCIVSLVLYAFLYLGSRPNPLFIFLYEIELKTLDMRFQLRGERPPTAPIAIVTIDQKSQDVLGHWPFSRSHFAEALDALKNAGAKVVAFDVTFPQPDDNSSLETLRHLQKEYGKGPGWNPGFAAQLKTLEAGADTDQQFAEAIHRFDNTILGYFLLFKTDEKDLKTQNKARTDEFINYLSFQALQVAHPEYGKLMHFEAAGVEPNLPKLAENAKNFGFVNVIPDADGVVRREPMLVRFQDNYYPSLDVATVLAYNNRSLDQVAAILTPAGLERIDFGPLAIPSDPDGYVQIDYHGPSRTYPWYSLSDVIAGKLPKDEDMKKAFANKIVLIGATATGIGDLRPTPFEPTNFPGVEVHANFIDNLLTGQFIHRGLRENLIDIGFILLFSLVAGVLLSVLPASRATAVIATILVLFLWLTYYLFASRRIWIAAFLPTSTLALNYVAIVSYRFFFEEREKKKVRAAFSQYVAPGIVDRLLKDPDLLRLGGDEKVLTAMFTDIRGFTAISEGLSPGALVELLNEYLSEMTEVIFRNWGTLDKYIGDAIMAFWGAPFPQPDHAERACRAALEMLQVLKRLQERWVAEGRSHINIGVGLNTGPMVVGNMGSNHRFNFTIMGDNVNLASRLEGINKEFGTRLIISEYTRQAAGKNLVVRELDLIRVQGKMRPVRIYELLALDNEKEKYIDLVERFHQGLECYRGGQWDAATEIFGKLVEDYPTDKPSRVFLDRCNHLIGQPPEGVWDGVFTMTHK